MSYSIHLELPICDKCGRGDAGPYCPDPTYNLAGIFHLALTGEGLPDPSAGTFGDVILHETRVVSTPCGLEVLTGKTGTESFPLLIAAIARLHDPSLYDAFHALEPTNGWGDMSGARIVINKLRDLAEEHPAHVWRVR
jgi:hypothetical protein